MASTSSPCKVCAALDRMSDEDADTLDADLVRESSRTITRRLNGAGYPISKSSVLKHRQGRCPMGLDYRAIA